MSVNTEYELGDLLLVFLDKITHVNQIYIIYKSYDSDLDEVTGYPINKEGLDLAKLDNDETISTFRRETPYTISGFSKSKYISLIENPSLSLDSTQKYYYDQIISRLDV